MENKRDRIIAALLTLLLGGAAVVVLVFTAVGNASAALPHAGDPDEAEVFFADIDYKEILSDPTEQIDGEVASAAATEVSGTDMTDAGGGEGVPDLLAGERPRPEGEQVARPEKPKPPAPTKEEIEAERRARIRERLGAATGLHATDNGQSSGSASAGHANSGNNPTSDGLGLDGRRLLNKPNPGITNAQGRVKVRITVNAAGAVTKAEYVSSTGFGNREAEVRAACVRASKELKYSPSDRTSQSGTITWIIR